MPLREDVQAALGNSYTVERELGGGGMSRVFIARDTSLERDVVVKVLPPDMAGSVNLERFRREIQLAPRLQRGGSSSIRSMSRRRSTRSEAIRRFRIS